MLNIEKQSKAYAISSVNVSVQTEECCDALSILDIVCSDANCGSLLEFVTEEADPWVKLIRQHGKIIENFDIKTNLRFSWRRW